MYYETCPVNVNSLERKQYSSLFSNQTPLRYRFDRLLLNTHCVAAVTFACHYQQDSTNTTVRLQIDNFKTNCLTVRVVKSVRFEVEIQECDKVVRTDSILETTFSRVFVFHGGLNLP